MQLKKTSQQNTTIYLKSWKNELQIKQAAQKDLNRLQRPSIGKITRSVNEFY